MGRGGVARRVPSQWRAWVRLLAAVILASGWSLACVSLAAVDPFWRIDTVLYFLPALTYVGFIDEVASSWPRSLCSLHRR